MNNKTKTFKERVRKIYGDKYILDKVTYINYSTKVCIICPEHGEFLITPHSFLKGKGCPKCYKEKQKQNNQENFLRRAKQIHGDKYNYSKVEYINSNSKVCIICPIHGEFWQTPNGHLRGQGCPTCGKIFVRNNKFSNTKEFIEKAKKIHGDKYDYSKVEYKHNKKKVCIICPIHGEFWQTPNGHLHGYGCPNCVKNKKKTQEEVIKKAKEIHGNLYTYENVEYINNETKINVTCKIHGSFLITPHHLLSNHGCPKCRESLYEKKVRVMLERENIKYIYCANKMTLPWLNKLQLDFYLPEYNVAIECQGIQHFEPIGFFGGYKTLMETIKRDHIKYRLCKENNIKLLYYSELDYPNMIGNVEDLLRKLRSEMLLLSD